MQTMKSTVGSVGVLNVKSDAKPVWWGQVILRSLAVIYRLGVDRLRYASHEISRCT